MQLGLDWKRLAVIPRQAHICSAQKDLCPGGRSRREPSAVLSRWWQPAEPHSTVGLPRGVAPWMMPYSDCRCPAVQSK